MRSIECQKTIHQLLYVQFDKLIWKISSDRSTGNDVAIKFPTVYGNHKTINMMHMLVKRQDGETVRCEIQPLADCFGDALFLRPKQGEPFFTCMNPSRFIRGANQGNDNINSRCNRFDIHSDGRIADSKGDILSAMGQIESREKRSIRLPIRIGTKLSVISLPRT